MNEDIVELLVRLACGESSEPPLRGLVQVDDERYRVWKHGERLRVETDVGELRSIREAGRVLTFLDGDDRPLESGPGALGFDDEDGDVSHGLLARPRLHALKLDERRVVGAVQRGERFGRPTAAVTLDHTYHDDFATTMVLDAVTGMPFELVEAGSTLLEWLELEELDVVDDSLLRWDGATRRASRFAYVDASEEADDAAEERSAGFDHSPLVARVPMDIRVESFEPGLVAIDLESGTEPVAWVDPARFRAELGTRNYRHEWSWIAERDGRPPGHARLSPRRRNRGSPLGRRRGPHLVRTRQRRPGPALEFNVDVDARWRDSPAAVKAVEWRARAAHAGGVTRTTERLSFARTDAKPWRNDQGGCASVPSPTTSSGACSRRSPREASMLTRSPPWPSRASRRWPTTTWNVRSRRCRPWRASRTG